MELLIDELALRPLVLEGVVYSTGEVDDSSRLYNLLSRLSIM